MVENKMFQNQLIYTYTQELHTLVHKFYPSVQQGTGEAEALGQSNTTN